MRRTRRRFAGLVVVSAVLVLTLLLSAFGAASPGTVPMTTISPPSRLVATGPPQPQVVASYGSLRLQLPVAQPQVTAVGYHAVGNGAVQLEPVGRQGNRGWVGRLVDRIVGAPQGGLLYYDLGGADGPARSALDVGAAPDTDVFSPADGVVIGIVPFVLDGQRHGVRIDVQPTSAPSLVVSLTRLRRDPAITVGAPVVAGVSKLGTLLDLSAVERQALGRYTQDEGNHVSIEVRPAASVALP